MPRNVRNFWADFRIDGRATRLDGGPQRRDGGLSGALYQRAGGEIVRAVTLDALAISDGGLRLDVSAGPDRSGPLLAQIFTHRDAEGFRVERSAFGVLDVAALRVAANAAAAEGLAAVAAALDGAAEAIARADAPEALAAARKRAEGF